VTQVPTGHELSAYDPQARQVVTGLGMTGMDPDAIALPRIAITQGLSQVVNEGLAQTGVFYNLLTSQVIGTAFDFVPALSFQNRVYFKVGTGLSCRSVDTITGQGDPGGTCEVCSMSQWPADGSGGPPCSVSHNWLGLMVGRPAEEARASRRGGQTTISVEECAPEIAVVQWRSMATAAAKTLNGLHLNSSLMSGARHWHDRVYRLSVKEQRNAKGSFFVPKVELLGASKPEHREVATRLLQMIAGRTLEFVPEEGVDPAAGEARAEAADAGRF
jgi:hypothetical protein